MQGSTKTKKPESMGKAALLFGSGTLTSRILGLIRDSLLFSMMPLDMKDAWLAAFRLPNFFRRLLGEGGLSVSFIPVYVGLQSEGQKVPRQNLIDGVFSLLMSVVSLICLICFVFMDTIVESWLSGEGFVSVPGKIEMTIAMSRIMVFFLFFISIFAYFMALLNGLKKFTLTGFAPLFLNISIIVGLLAYEGSYDLAVASAWSVVIGGAMQALFLLAAVRGAGVLPRIRMNWNNPQVKKVMAKFVPTIFGVGVLQVLAMINVYFASQLESGAISYIYLADRLLELPLSLIAVSIGTTLLPSLSQYWSEGQRQTFSQSLSEHLSLFYFLAIPSTFGLWFLGADIIDVLFTRGQFTPAEVPIVAGVLKVYCLTLLAAGSLKLVNQAFYATGDTLTPALVSVGSLLVHLFTAPRLMDQFGINGLVLSTAVVTLLNLIVCVFLLQNRTGRLQWLRIGSHFGKCVLAGSALGYYLYLISGANWKFGRFLYDFPVLLLIVFMGAALFFTLAHLLRVEEMRVLINRLTRRRRAKRPPSL